MAEVPRPPIIPRAAWGARHDDGFGSAPTPARELWLHHSVTIAPDLVPPFDDDDDAVRLLERIGESRFGRGISYTFAATPSGRLYEGHSVGRRGAHVAKRNSVARSVVLVGDHRVTPPTGAQLDGVAWLAAYGAQQGWWLRPRFDGGHRDAPGAATTCPGDAAEETLAEINRRAAAIYAGTYQPWTTPAIPTPPPPPPWVGMAASPAGGYWLARSSGDVHTFGGAPYLGGANDPARPLVAPIVGIATSPAFGAGYWLAAADGGVFAYGDALFHGGMAGRHLTAPIRALVPTPTGRGYWLAAADGGVFAFGDAVFHGSAHGRP